MKAFSYLALVTAQDQNITAQLALGGYSALRVNCNQITLNNLRQPPNLVITFLAIFLLFCYTIHESTSFNYQCREIRFRFPDSIETGYFLLFVLRNLKL